MSDNIKLIIEIPEPIYDRIKYLEPNADTMLDKLMRAVQNGIPLDSVKAEIKEKCDRINIIFKSVASVLSYQQHREIQELLCEILTSIDKTESEDKG